MQTKELETLDHAPLRPGEQMNRTRLHSFPKDTLPVLGDAFMFSSAMPSQRVKTCQTHMTQFARHGGSRDRLARRIESSRLCNSAVIVMSGQALRGQVFLPAFFRLDVGSAHKVSQSEAPTSQTVLRSMAALAE